MLRRICVVQTQPMKHVLGHAKHTVPTRQHDLQAMQIIQTRNLSAPERANMVNVRSDLSHGCNVSKPSPPNVIGNTLYDAAKTVPLAGVRVYSQARRRLLLGQPLRDLFFSITRHLGACVRTVRAKPKGVGWTSTVRNTPYRC